MGERLGSDMGDESLGLHIETGPEKGEQPLIPEDRDDKPERAPKPDEIIQPEE